MRSVTCLPGPFSSGWSDMAASFQSPQAEVLGPLHGMEEPGKFPLQHGFLR